MLLRGVTREARDTRRDYIRAFKRTYITFSRPNGAPPPSVFSLRAHLAPDTSRRTIIDGFSRGTTRSDRREGRGGGAPRRDRYRNRGFSQFSEESAITSDRFGAPYNADFAFENRHRFIIYTCTYRCAVSELFRESRSSIPFARCVDSRPRIFENRIFRGREKEFAAGHSVILPLSRQISIGYCTDGEGGGGVCF